MEYPQGLMWSVIIVIFDDELNGSTNSDTEEDLSPELLHLFNSDT